MDFVKILGGLALGATGAALYDALRSGKKIGAMGQGVVTGGPGGGFGGGPGLVVGPPSGGSAAGFGPGIVDFMPEGGGEGAVGPIVSVRPEVFGPGLPGGSFFGVNSSPWFWPLNVNWLYPRPPRSMVCVETKNKDDEKVTFCQESYAARPLYGQETSVYAWGPPAGWL